MLIYGRLMSDSLVNVWLVNVQWANVRWANIQLATIRLANNVQWANVQYWANGLLLIYYYVCRAFLILIQVHA